MATKTGNSRVSLRNVLCLVAAFCITFCLPAEAQTHQFATGIVCDSAKLAEQFVAFAENGSPEEAIAEINAAAKEPTACMMLQIAYTEMAEVKTFQAVIGIVRIVEITVVAIRTTKGFERMVPTSQFIVTLIPPQIV